MYKRIAFGLSIILLLFAACQAQVEKKPASFQEIKPSMEKPAWQIEWEETMAAAKKEGRLKIFTSLEPNVIKLIADEFKGKFGIEVEFIAGRGPEIIPKLFAERRAGLYTADVYIGGTDPILYSIRPAGILAPLKPALFLPEVLDTKLWYKNTLPWVDREQSLVLQTKGGPEPGEVVLNTNLVKKGEMTSYHDLLQPKYKGKINITDPTISGRGNKWFGSVLFFKSLDIDYMKKMASQQPVLVRDKRLQIEWVAKEKHLVAMLPNSPQTYEFMEIGAPIDYIRLKESKLVLGGGSSGVSLIKDPPYPQSARFFLNWFLSKEGQASFSRAYVYQSFRVDVPTDHLPANQIRARDIDYPVETEDFLDFIRTAGEQAKEIFGPLLR